MCYFWDKFCVKIKERMNKEKSMNILLVHPQYPDTFWSLRYALQFISKKATHLPLGLLTVAAILPEEWKKKLIDFRGFEKES
jgi:hypothetical protein